MPVNLKEDFKQTGDLAELAMKYKSKQAKAFVKPKPLTINRVLTSMRKIVDTQKIQNSGSEKNAILTCLYQDSNKLEAKYLTRIALGKMRLGMQKKTFLVALSDFLCYFMLVDQKQLKSYDKMKNSVTIVEYIDRAYKEVTSYKATQAMIEEKLSSLDVQQNLTLEQVQHIMQITDVNELLQNYLSNMQIKKSSYEGNVRLLASVYVYHAYQLVPSFTKLILNIKQLQTIKITHFIPLEPMLAKPTTSFENELTNQGFYFGEHKYDGFRAQIHYYNNQLRIYSRQLENMSTRFYDVLDTVQDMINKLKVKPQSFIFDSEIVPVDRNTGIIIPFQYLSRRLQSANAEDRKIQEKTTFKVKIMNFDIIEYNGYDLTKTPFVVRRQILRNVFQETELYRFCHSVLIQDQDTLSNNLNEAVAMHTEGLIIKSVGGLYLPDKRSDDWLKLKKDYLNNVGDSLDLVIVGGAMGKGKRTGTIGSYLAACYNDKTDKFETVTQLGTGVTDEDLQEITERLRKVEIKGKQSNVIISNKMMPELFFDCMNSLVIEVKVADLSRSPAHTCGLNELGFGIAARLPRVVRIREDKQPIECSTTQFVIDCFKNQANRQQKSGTKETDDLNINFKEESDSTYIEESEESDQKQDDL